MNWLKTTLVRTKAVDAMIVATRSRMRILMYHGVSPYCLKPSIFEEQLKYIRSRFRSHWASEIPEVLDSRRPWHRPAIVLTFDDGLLNNLTYAVPLLQQYGVKATFFVVSDLLDGESMLWNHELLCRLLLTKDQDLPDGIGPFGERRPERFITLRRFIDDVKSWEYRDRCHLLDTLREQYPDPSYEPWMLDKYRIMSREDLRQLPDNIEIGSHTRTHAILIKIDDDLAHDEIHNSQIILESIIDKPVHSFCYPNGQFSIRDERLARGSYSVAVTVEEGLVGSKDNRHRLDRIPVAHNMRDFSFRMIRPASGEAAPMRIPDSI